VVLDWSTGEVLERGEGPLPAAVRGEVAAGGAVDALNEAFASVSRGVVLSLQPVLVDDQLVWEVRLDTANGREVVRVDGT
jgi:hypothetical protein